MAEVYRRRIEQVESLVNPAYRLGRHVEHDPRSLEYLVPEGAKPTTKILWPRRIPILDQGEVGSCTGNATVGALGTDPYFTSLAAQIAAGLKLAEPEAVTIYSDAEIIDGDGPYPPNDFGSSGLSVAKAALARGLISGYLHMTSLAAAYTAIASGPFIKGSDWWTSMDSPTSAGVVTVSGSVRGGHEYLVRGYDPATGLWFCDNSWGTGFGVAGSFEMSDDSFSKLLADDGDCTSFVPVGAPAPVPTPPVPTPFPVPTPTPSPVPTPTPAPVVSVADVALWAKVGPWTRLRHTGQNHDTAQYLIEWALDLGLPTGPHEPEHLA